MILRPLFTATFLALATPALAADFALFEMTGNWRGTGTIRAKLDHPAQDGRCRMQAVPIVTGQEMQLTGRCATPQGASKLTMQFALHQGGVIAGGIASPSLPETLQFIGQIEGNIARLHSRAPVTVDNQAGNITFTLTLLDPGTFDLVEWFQPEGTTPATQLVRMRFQRGDE